MSKKSASKGDKDGEADEKPRPYHTDWEKEPWARGKNRYTLYLVTLFNKYFYTFVRFLNIKS